MGLCGVARGDVFVRHAICLENERGLRLSEIKTAPQYRELLRLLWCCSVWLAVWVMLTQHQKASAPG